MDIKKISIFILLICLVIVSISAVSAASERDVTTGTQFSDIQGVIDVSTDPGDVIKLGNKTYTSSPNGTAINVSNNKNITIRGDSDSNRATLNANNLQSIFLIDNTCNVTLMFINFEKGGFEDGAVVSYGNLIIENCTFTQSMADQGSAISIFGTDDSSTIINYCNFTDNNVNSEGGAIFYFGNGRLNISNSYFYDNSGKNGGAIYTSALTTITSSVFINNFARTNGGAIYTTRLLNMNDSTVKGNNASYGSGIYNSATLNLDNVSFINNNAQIVGIFITGPEAVNKGDSLTITAYLTNGDNIINAIYSKTYKVTIDGDSVDELYDKILNKDIILNINNKIYTANTGLTGIATFKVTVSPSSKSEVLKVVASFSEAGQTVTKVKTIDVFDNVIIIDLKPGTLKNKINVGKKPLPNLLKDKPSLSLAKIKALLKKLKSKKSTKTKTFTQAYMYKNKKMVWVNVKNSASVDSYPAGLRKVTETTTTQVRYILIVKNRDTSKFNPNTKTTLKHKILYVVKGKKLTLVQVTKIVVKQKASNLPNKYLSPSTGADSKNPMIVSLAKKITKGCKSDDYYTKAKLIYKWVQENIDYTLNADTSAVAILSKKGSNGHYKAYCVGFSNTMAALCQAVGVPVQYHAILFFEQDQYPFEGHSGHVYSKVYVNGKWLFADAATVGFIAPLNYHGYLQDMKTQPGGSYYTADNKWNYWSFNCNHFLTNHLDNKITREVQGVPVLEYFNLSLKTKVVSASSAYNLLKSYANQNGYLIMKNYYFTGTSDYLDPNNSIPVWAFHYFDANSGTFQGYMVLSQSGILFPVLNIQYITPRSTGIPLEYY